MVTVCPFCSLSLTEGDSNSRIKPSFANPTSKFEFKTATSKYFSGGGLVQAVKRMQKKAIAMT